MGRMGTRIRGISGCKVERENEKERNKEKEWEEGDEGVGERDAQEVISTRLAGLAYFPSSRFVQPDITGCSQLLFTSGDE